MLRLTLFEFLACVVRIAFVRANPKHGQYDNTRKPIPLPGCLEKMLTEVLLPNAKQDQASLFRDELAADADVQLVVTRYATCSHRVGAAVSRLCASVRMSLHNGVAGTATGSRRTTKRRAPSGSRTRTLLLPRTQLAEQAMMSSHLAAASAPSAPGTPS